MYDVVVEDDRAALAHALSTREAFTFDARTGDGETVLFLDMATRDEDGARIVGIAPGRLPELTTVGDRRLAQLMLEIDEGFVVFDTTPAIVECNEACLRILHTTREQLIGRSSLTEAGFPIFEVEGDLLSPEEGPVGRCLATGEPVEDVVFQARTPVGPRWIKATVRPIKNRGRRDRARRQLLHGRDRAPGRSRTPRSRRAPVRHARRAASPRRLRRRGRREGDEHLHEPQVEELFGVPIESFTDSGVFW